MKLSILICSTMTRVGTFLPAILGQFNKQLAALNEEDRKNVEVLTLIDNRQMSVGAKRNHLVSVSSGQYVVFVDDDDRVSDRYIVRLLNAISYQADAITFTVSVSINEGQPKPSHYSTQYGRDHNTLEAYYRLPNHIMCIRRELMVQTPFKDLSYGEDSDFARRLMPLIKSEHHINEVLYHYDFNASTSETQSERL